MPKISQREARRLQKRVAQLESELSNQRHVWACDWPGGVHIASQDSVNGTAGIVRTARKLGHAVVVVARDNGELLFYGLPLGQQR